MRRAGLAAVLVAALAAALAVGSGFRPQTPPASAVSVVGLGDSVVAGTACDCAGIPAEYADALTLSSGRLVSPTNLGAGGETTADLLSRLHDDQDVRSSLRHADVVLVVEGANDLTPQLEATQDADGGQGPGCGARCRRHAAQAMGDRLARALDRVRSLAPSATVLVAGYWNVFADGDAAHEDESAQVLTWSRLMTEDANTAIRAAARTAGATYVDLAHAFTGRTGHDPTPLLADDGDHPDQEGVATIVDAFMARTPAD